MKYRQKLDATGSLTEVFDLVKDAAADALNESRAGLDIGFQELGNSQQCIFAYYPVGSNIIVMNKTPLRRIMETKPEMLRPYVFSTLLHEYLHSLGYLDEMQVRALTCTICTKLFGDSMVTDLACNINSYLHYLTYPGGVPASGREMHVVEIEEQEYIG